MFVFYHRHLQNYKRVAAVWMDEYAEYIYMRRPSYRNLDPGDISKQKALREKLQCKPFKWFMENIAFDLPLKYPPVEPLDYASGYIKSIKNPELCVVFKSNGERLVYGSVVNEGALFYFRLCPFPGSPWPTAI